MNMQTLYRKLFLSGYFFTIALRKRGEGTRKSRLFCPDFIMPASRDHWAADPILVDHEGRTYLFYEAVDHDRGHIAVSEVLADGSLTTPKVVLQDGTHYSYPFVFRHEGVWYMIPESSEAREVRLYRAVHFPEAWELCTVLLHERAVDTTVFERKGQCYLLTFLTDGLSERVSPRAYAMDFSESGIALRSLAWKDYNELRVRGAGPVFRDGLQQLRPAQVSQEQRYGDAVVFYRVSISKEGFEEKPEFELRAEDLIVPGIYADGLHTYCVSEYFEAIDIRCREFDFWKSAKKALSYFKQ